MSRVLFSVWFSIQGIIQNTTCSVWFRIQHIIKKCPGYYSVSGSVFRVLFKIRLAASGSGFSVLLKNVQGIIQRLVQYSGCYSKYDLQRQVQDSAYYSKMSRVLFRVWFIIQGIIQNTTCSIWFRIQRIIKKCPGYYSASGSVFRVLFKIRPAASGSGFSVLLKNVHSLSGSLFRVLLKIRPAASGSGFSVLFRNVQGIIQSLVQDSAYYSEMSRVLFSIWFRIQGFIQNTTCRVWFRIQRIIQKCPGYYSAYGSVFSVLLKNVQSIIQSLVHNSAYF